MTFKKIEKEFDELFVEPNEGFWKLGDKGTYYRPSHIKSFLKQSFIKYLQSEVEACNQYKSYYNQTGDQFNKGKHEAMSHMVNRLEAQIKELEA